MKLKHINDLFKIISNSKKNSQFEENIKDIKLEEKLNNLV